MPMFSTPEGPLAALLLLLFCAELPLPQAESTVTARPPARRATRGRRTRMDPHLIVEWWNGTGHRPRACGTRIRRSRIPGCVGSGVAERSAPGGTPDHESRGQDFGGVGNRRP